MREFRLLVKISKKNQITLQKEKGCEKIFTDIASGVREDRIGLNGMPSFVKRCRNFSLKNR